MENLESRINGSLLLSLYNLMIQDRKFSSCTIFSSIFKYLKKNCNRYLFLINC